MNGDQTLHYTKPCTLTLHCGQTMRPSDGSVAARPEYGARAAAAAAAAAAAGAGFAPAPAGTECHTGGA